MLSSSQTDRGLLFWGWFHVALGSAGVILVSVFYFCAPPMAAGPNLRVDMIAAVAATLTDRGALRYAGVTGAIVDPMIAVGAFLLTLVQRGSTRRSVALYWLAASALLFTVADIFAGFMLRESAAAGVSSFAFVKPCFDALVASSSFGYGLSAFLLGQASQADERRGRRALGVALMIIGAGVTLSAIAILSGANAGAFLGLGLTLETTLFTLLGALCALDAKRMRS